MGDGSVRFIKDSVIATYVVGPRKRVTAAKLSVPIAIDDQGPIRECAAGCAVLRPQKLEENRNNDGIDVTGTDCPGSSSTGFGYWISRGHRMYRFAAIRQNGRARIECHPSKACGYLQSNT